MPIRRVRKDNPTLKHFGNVSNDIQRLESFRMTGESLG